MRILFASAALELCSASAYDGFSAAFPHEKFDDFLKELYKSMDDYKSTPAYRAYQSDLSAPHCDAGRLSGSSAAALSVRKISHDDSEHVSLLGMDAVSHVVNEFRSAQGPAAAQVPGIGALSSAALQQVKGILQATAAIAATDVPPLVPPPAWNNMPFPCMPMVTGHNCFGAVQYPITIGDFVMADMSDSALDGVVANFPSLYRSKVGNTDAATYDKCFSAYMSMQCAATFPMCTTVQAHEAQIPGLGRAPMCFVHCVATLVACPGLWIDDIADICQDVSVPPVCAMAFYHKASPPQLSSFDESTGYPLRCPKFDPEIDTDADASVLAKSVRGGAGESGSAPFPSA